MKRYCLPDTFVDEVLPTIPADAQAVLFALLWHSDNTFKVTWPSLHRIAKMSGIKSDKTVRTKIRLLEDRKIITRQSVAFGYKSHKGKSFTAMQNVYSFNFQLWIEKDIQLGKSKPEDFTSEAAIKNIAKETVDEIFAKIPDRLKQWLQHLEYKHKSDNVLYFNAKDKLPKSYVEGEFRKAGIKIAITSMTG